MRRERSDLYFAYGSNLWSARLQGRVASARAHGPARLAGYALRLDKRGADGTGKANLHAAPGATVWGVVYALDADDWPRLDACEPDYARVRVTVELADESVAVQTYRSDRLLSDPRAQRRYRQLMIDGAREHGLPAEWIAALEALAVLD